jgi:hypothetical protein
MSIGAVFGMVLKEYGVLNYGQCSGYGWLTMYALS